MSKHEAPDDEPSSVVLLTAHAEARCRARGTRRDLLQLLLAHADGEVPVGQGCRSGFLSRDAAEELVSLGAHPDLVRLARRRAVVHSADGVIATLLVPLAGARGRRYRRATGTSARVRVRGRRSTRAHRGVARW